MTKPLVSILIPTYNRVHVLPRVLKSARLQKYRPREIVVYDDGSTDGTEALLHRRVYKWVRYVRAKENRGVAHARNRLLSLAQGQIGCWLDSDDMANIWRLKLLYEVMREYRPPFVRSGFTRYSPSYLADIWKERPYFWGRHQFACATAMFDMAKAKQVPYDEDILVGEDMLWEKRFVLKWGVGKMLPATLYHIGRGKGLHRLTHLRGQQHQAAEWHKSRATAWERIELLITEIKAAGGNPSRDLERISEAETKALLDEICGP